MTREQQYWEDTQEALSRVFDKCEEIDPQSGYDMLEDIQFIRGFINKHKPRTEKQEPILDKVKQAREEIENEVKFWSEPSKYNVESVVNSRKAKAQSYKHCLEILDKLIEREE